MMTPSETATVWRSIVYIYNETREKGPKETMQKILERWDLADVKETFATVAKIKEHDGRIYGLNRKAMASTPTNPEAVERVFGNPMFTAGLDDIHPAHIHQMITELLHAEKKRIGI